MKIVHNQGRQFIGIEIDQEEFKSAKVNVTKKAEIEIANEI